MEATITGKALDAASFSVMHKYPVPGKIVREWVIPKQEFAGFTMKKGQVLRFVDIEGQQVPDVVCFDENDLSDEINLGNSILLNKRREFVKGDGIYSVACNLQMTIVGYSNGESYSYGPMCSEEVNHIRYGVPNTRNCRDNFAQALAPWGLKYREIPNAFVPFMRVAIDDQGVFSIVPPTSEPGDYYDMRAETDLLIGISNCPQERNPCNNFNPTPMGVIIYEPSEG